MQKVLYILGQLNDQDVEWLITAGKKMQAPTGTTLIQEGVAAKAFYIVLDGLCSVTSQATGSREITRHGAGEVLGEMSFVDSRPPSATVKVVDNAVLLAVPRDELSRKLDRDTGFAARFYRALSIFLSYRLRATSAMAAGKSANADDEDELDANVLDNVSIAGTRFKRILEEIADH